MFRTFLLFGLFILVMTGCRPDLKEITESPNKTPESTQTSQPMASSLPNSIETPLPSETATSAGLCFTTHYDPIAFLPNGTQLLGVGNDSVELFNLLSMQNEDYFKAPGILNGPSIAVSPDGEMFAWAFEDGLIQGIRLSDRSTIYNIDSGQTGLIKLEFSPNGDHLDSASHDGTVNVWDNQGNLLDTLQPGGELLNIGISPDEKTLATIPFDGPVKLWSLVDFHMIRDLSGSGGYDTSDAVFSVDGQYLAADLATGLFLWNTSDGKEILAADAPINSLAVAYSPDGKYLAYSDNNVAVLSSPDGSQIIQTLEGQNVPIYELLFSPDSSKLVSVDDQAIRIWRVEDGKLLTVGKSECP